MYKSVRILRSLEVGNLKLPSGVWGLLGMCCVITVCFDVQLGGDLI